MIIDLSFMSYYIEQPGHCSKSCVTCDHTNSRSAATPTLSVSYLLVAYANCPQLVEKIFLIPPNCDVPGNLLLNALTVTT